MKVADIIKLIPDNTNISIGYYDKVHECGIGKDSFDCEYSDDENCGNCAYIYEHDSFLHGFKGECSDAPIKLADRTVLGLDIDITASGRGKKAETTISLKIITRKPKED